MAPKHGVCLRVAYDGMGFCGWQVQQGQRTVQQVLEQAVHEVSGEPLRVFGASRTDTKVHALDQVASFTVTKELPPRSWLHALNQALPEDVVVRQVAACRPNFNPRFAAAGKLYRYLIRTGPFPDPLTRARAWQVVPPLVRRRGDELQGVDKWLSISAMQQAAARLEGTHDFRAFQSSRDYRTQTTRTLHAVRLVLSFSDDPTCLALEVHGVAFLKHMVRIMVGTLVDVGRGRFEVSAVSEALSAGATRQRAGKTAPGHGLYLVHTELHEQLQWFRPDAGQGFVYAPRIA